MFKWICIFKKTCFLLYILFHFLGFYYFCMIQNIFKASKIGVIMTYSKAKKTKETPVWLKFSEKDTEAIVVKLAKQGLTSEKIGLELRDTYGIPTTKIAGKKVSQILKENNLYNDATAVNLEKKQHRISTHSKKNKQDKRAKLALSTISARISKYKKYKKRK